KRFYRRVRHTPTNARSPFFLFGENFNASVRKTPDFPKIINMLIVVDFLAPLKPRILKISSLAIS
ncbi:MAG: hypothetical protein ACRC2V_24730, partial [Xenococcaceae cyanobacterium]